MTIPPFELQAFKESTVYSLWEPRDFLKPINKKQFIGEKVSEQLGPILLF